MILNDTTDKTGIFQEIDSICNSDTNSFPVEAKLRRVNNSIDRFMTLAFKADGRWSYDDLTYATEPIETQDLIANQQAYSKFDFASEILKLMRVEILGNDDTPILLKRLNKENVNVPLSVYKSTPSTPEEYDIYGNSFYLYPAPNYNKTDGLKVYFNRNAARLTSSSYSLELNIPSLFHPYIARLSSLQYLIENQKAQKNDISEQINKDEIEITNFFQGREKGIKKQLTPIRENNK